MRYPFIVPSLIVLAAVQLAAQQPVPLSPPFELPSGVQMRRDVVYRVRGADTMRVDLFLPSGPERHPAVVYVGDPGGPELRTHLWRQAAFLATRGFAGAAVDYRRQPTGEPRLPEAVQDVMGAVTWLRQHAPEVGIDPSRIGLVGAAEGGLVAALAATASFPPGGGPDGYSRKVQGMVLFSPLLDVRDTTLAPLERQRIEAAVGRSRAEDPGHWNTLSPLYYTERPEMRHVGPTLPPSLFLHGAADTIVPPAQSTAMVEGMRHHGYAAEVMIVDGAGHGFYDRQPGFARTLEALDAFFTRTLADSVTDRRWDDSHPSWSPDGSRIAFVSDAGGRYSLWTMRADGTDLHDLGVSASYPSWSPDGRRIAYADGSDRLRMVNADGTGEEYVTQDSTEAVGEVSWSPDGARIAFLSWLDGQVYVVRLIDRIVARVQIPSPWNSCPAWTPDGSRVILNSERDGQADLFLTSVDGSNPVRITDTPVHEFCPRVSPDGRLVAFQRRLASDHTHIDLMTVGIDGSSPRNLTDHLSNDRYPTWSPDGRWIAFNSTRDGNSDIYVIRADGSGLRRLTHR